MDKPGVIVSIDSGGDFETVLLTYFIGSQYDDLSDKEITIQILTEEYGDTLAEKFIRAANAILTMNEIPWEWIQDKTQRNMENETGTRKWLENFTHLLEQALADFRSGKLKPSPPPFDPHAQFKVGSHGEAVPYLLLPTEITNEDAAQRMAMGLVVDHGNEVDTWLNDSNHPDYGRRLLLTRQEPWPVPLGRMRWGLKEVFGRTPKTPSLMWRVIHALTGNRAKTGNATPLYTGRVIWEPDGDGAGSPLKLFLSTGCERLHEIDERLDWYLTCIYRFNMEHRLKTDAEIASLSVQDKEAGIDGSKLFIARACHWLGRDDFPWQDIAIAINIRLETEEAVRTWLDAYISLIKAAITDTV